MKYPLYILPNQNTGQVVIQAERGVLESIIQDFGGVLKHRSMIVIITNQLRDSDDRVVKVHLTRSHANELLQMVGLSY